MLKSVTSSGGAATTIAPGTPISGGTGAFTTLSASTSFVSNGTWGVQAVLGKVGQAGRLDFIRGDTGASGAFLGFVGASIGSTMDLSNPGGVLRLVSQGAVGLEVALTNGVLCTSLGAATSSARLTLPAGQSSVGRAPLKLTTGTNLTVVENGAFEFDGSNLFFTHTGVRRTITMV